MGKTASDLRKEGWPPDEMQKYHPWQAAERYTEDPDAVARRGRAMEVSREARTHSQKEVRGYACRAFWLPCSELIVRTNFGY